MPLSKNDLRDFSSLHRKTKRQELGLFIVEGKKNCLELVKSNFEVLCICTTDSNNADFVDAIQITTKEATRISHLKNPSPYMAIVKIPEVNYKIEKKPILFYLDQINDPGNLGTIVRTLDWFGFNQVICSPHTVDAYNSKTVMASMGSVFRVNVIYKEFKTVLEEFSSHKIVTTQMNGNNIYNHAIQQSSIIVFGNEANGISKQIESLSDVQVQIPKFGKAESLNVSISVGIVANEIKRLSFKG